MPLSSKPRREYDQSRWGAKHKALRKEFDPVVRAGNVRCVRCGERILPWEPWDLGHVDGNPSRYAGPEHRACNRATAGRNWKQPLLLEVEPERDGLAWSDRRWRVPWLTGLRRPPADATWPRLMSVPHVRAVGSFGREFSAWAEWRSGRPLRWWQQLAAARILEHDTDGRLVWEAAVLSMARQCGKSWLLRELCLWRIHQGERWNEPQDVLHTGKDLAVCKEVQRPARVWAKARSGEYKVREVNGQEEIELLADGSRWMLRAKEAVYGYSVSLGAADEAWKVKPYSIKEGLEPTMVERESPQLLLVSTAHRLATPLMLEHRAVALEQLEEGDGELLIEWSAPRDSAVEAVESWRLASPHWGEQRQRTIRKQLDAAMSNQFEDPDETDPIAWFRSQWLNEWPVKATDQTGLEDLLPPGVWENLAEPGVRSTGSVWVALEDNFGFGAAVAVIGVLPDGRLEVDGWLRHDWDSAVEDVQRLGRPIRELRVGASMLDRVPATMVPRPQPANSTNTRVGLSLLRDLAGGGQLVHDEVTGEIDEAFALAQVRESSTGLLLVGGGDRHLVRAVVWAVGAAHKPAPVPAIR